MPLTTRPASTSRHGMTRTATVMTSPGTCRRVIAAGWLLKVFLAGPGGAGSLDAAGVDAADQDGAGAEVVELVHDPVGFPLGHHRADGHPVRIAQRRHGGRLQAGGEP